MKQSSSFIYVFLRSLGVPHAVILIAEREREHVDGHGIVQVPISFLPLLERCKGFRVVLYQSARQSGRAKPAVGYYATAVVEAVHPHPADETMGIVLLKDMICVTEPKRMITNGLMEEPALKTKRNLFKGWTAAQRVRELSAHDLFRLTGQHDDSPTIGPELELPPLPRFSLHAARIRDPKFHDLVYRAYKGCCSISGVTLLSPANICGLVAAHIFPHSAEAYNFVAAGILLAPSWHERFDSGAIIIHDDYRWTALIEDSDTYAIQQRQLLLPANKHERPHQELLRRKRALFGQP